MMRSGRSDAIFSNSKPSAVLSTVGFAPPSSSCAQGQTADGCSPYHSVVAIGFLPSARTMSCSLRPMTAIRCGSDGHRGLAELVLDRDREHRAGLGRRAGLARRRRPRHSGEQRGGGRGDGHERSAAGHAGEHGA